MRQEEENRPLRIYQCEDTQDGILTAVYEAGISGYGHKYIRIAPIREGETESFVLFAEYITVVTDPEHARIVLDKVQSGISRNAYEYVMYALASNDPEKANLVYQFVTYGFTIGRRVTDAMQIPCVKAIFALQRRVRNEAAWFREILQCSFQIFGGVCGTFGGDRAGSPYIDDDRLAFCRSPQSGAFYDL